MPDFATLTLIIFLSVLYGKSSRMGAFSMVLLRLPTTLAHELAHLAAALITFAKPTNIDITPRRADGGGWVLGSVECERLYWFNAFPVGMAPILVNLPLAWWAYGRETTVGYIWSFLLLTAALPSDQDLKVALTTSILGGAAWIAGLTCAGYLFFIPPQ